MRATLLLPALLVSCAGMSRTTVVDGSTTMTVEEIGSLGGKTFSHVTRSAKGAIAITKRNDMEKSWTDTTQAGTTIAGGIIYAGVTKAKDAADAAVSINASKQATKNAAINAAVESEKIKAGVEATRILNPTPP